MEQTNNVQNYLQNINRKNLFLNKAEDYNKLQHTSQIEGLRLLSINKVSKILGIRYETVVNLVRKGSINSVIINNKYKVPYSCLIDYVNGTKEENKDGGLIIPLEETQNKINNLFKEYSE